MERSDETTTGLVTPARVTTGGNMSAACIKQEPSSAFMPRKYVPDGRVYEGLYERGATLFMSPEQEKLYLDRLWLDAQANPERSLGDYMPNEMAKQLGRLHEALMPPFKPSAYDTSRAQPRSAKKRQSRRASRMADSSTTRDSFLTRSSRTTSARRR